MITWDVKIQVISIASKEISLVATRTDDISGKVRIFTVPRAMIATAEQKLAIMDEVWAKYQAELNEESAVNTFIGTLEEQAKLNLEARE